MELETVNVSTVLAALAQGVGAAPAVTVTVGMTANVTVRVLAVLAAHPATSVAVRVTVKLLRVGHVMPVVGLASTEMVLPDGTARQAGRQGRHVSRAQQQGVVSATSTTALPHSPAVLGVGVTVTAVVLDAAAMLKLAPGALLARL
jgi:hypothetical protein